MATSGESLDENLENYKAQLKQVEAALLIDENNEDLKKLQQDLLEVIELTEELSQMNEAPPTVATSVPDSTSSSSSTTTNSTTITATKAPAKKEWKSGDRCKALRKTDGQYHLATVDMIADDKISCTIKFDNSGSVDVVKLSSLEVVQDDIQSQTTASDNIQNKNNKLTKEEIEKRREIKKKKLLKKKQRMKDFEEAREAGKNKWQNFCKKGSLKGKNKVKGLNKKSIFASCEDGKGKIGVGTCGTSGRTMTSYTPASVYMYKK